jgi:hypothetical protein
MSEIVTMTMSQESDPVHWHALNLMRKALGEDKLPTIMLAWKCAWNKSGNPRPVLLPGYIPKIKTGSKAKPPIFHFPDDSTVVFYDFDWNQIDEAEYEKLLSAIDKNEFDYDNQNFAYNPYDKTYTIKGYKV